VKTADSHCLVANRPFLGKMEIMNMLMLDASIADIKTSGMVLVRMISNVEF
jgi:hypothetical protein